MCQYGDWITQLMVTMLPAVRRTMGVKKTAPCNVYTEQLIVKKKIRGAQLFLRHQHFCSNASRSYDIYARRNRNALTGSVLVGGAH